MPTPDVLIRNLFSCVFVLPQFVYDSSWCPHILLMQLPEFVMRAATLLSPSQFVVLVMSFACSVQVSVGVGLCRQLT